MKPSSVRWMVIGLGLLLTAQIVAAQPPVKPPEPFNHSKFAQAVMAVQGEDKNKVDRLRRWQRMDGLRLLIEVETASKAPAVFDRFKTLVRGKVSFEKLFPELVKRKYFPERGLDRFYQAIIRDFAFEDLEDTGTSVFDLTYFLRENLKDAKIEPDIPFAFFAPMIGLQCEDHDEQTADRAWPLREGGPPAGPLAGTMDVELAWQYTESMSRPGRGIGIRIAHPDTGYCDHADLRPHQENLDLGCGFNTLDDTSDCLDPLDYGLPGLFPGHGLSTASVIVSRGAIGIQPQLGQEGGTQAPGMITGVAPEASLIPIRCIRSVIRIFSGSVVRAVDYAVALEPPNETHVISISLGGLPSAALKTAIDLAVMRNIIVVAASGNYTWFVVAPAAFPSCIAVAASDVNAAIWRESGRGPQVDFAAPGKSVWRALRKRPSDPLDFVERACGTSLSTAEVAGVAALWLAYHGRDHLIGQLSYGQTLQELFRQTVKATVQVPGGWKTKIDGAGIVNAHKLLQAPIAENKELSGNAGGKGFSYIDYLLGILGPGYHDAVVSLLAKTFENQKKGVEEAAGYWGAELIYLLYTNNDVKDAFWDAVKHPLIPGNVARFVATLKKFGSHRLAAAL